MTAETGSKKHTMTDLPALFERMMSEDTADDDAEADRTETDQSTDPDPPGESQLVQDLDHRVEEIEAEVETTNTKLRSIRDEQESVSADIAEMQETVRELLGVYEQVTDDVNPFTDHGTPAEEFQFGVLGGGEAIADGGAEEPDDDSVGLDELRDASEDPEGAPAREDTTSASSEEGHPESTRPRDSRESPREEQLDEGPDAPIEDWSISPERREDPTPIHLADTYATDIIVSEWLSELIASSSPAAAINAISYYSDIGWLSSEAESYLLDVLSGPHLDAGVDPSESKSLEATDHAESYAYVRKLAAVQEMSGSSP